jgi:hypothetical protein
MPENTNSITYINMAFAGISALGGISGLLSVIILVKHRSKDKKEERLRLFLDRFQSRYGGHGGHFLEHLIPTGINLLKNDDEIEEALESLQSIYHTPPLRDWNSDVRRIGYKKFFKYVVDQTNELNANNIKGFIDGLNH